jgi:hypothetical protein
MLGPKAGLRVAGPRQARAPPARGANGLPIAALIHFVRKKYGTRCAM